MNAPERTPLKVKLSTLVSVTERAKKAEAEVERLRAAIRRCDNCTDGYVDGFGDFPEPCDVCFGERVIVDYEKARALTKPEGE